MTKDSVYIYNNNALAILIRKDTWGERGNLSYCRHHLHHTQKKRPESGSTQRGNLSKHLGDLGVCTPFSGTTESLELCNEPN